MEASNPPSVRILLIDDDVPGAALLRAVVRRRLPGCSIEHVARGDAGLTRLEEPPLPSLVLVDVRLPGIDGFGVVEAIRADPRTADLPVVLWSGARDPTLAEHAARVGVTWFAHKPLDVVEHHAFLQRLIELADARPSVGLPGEREDAWRRTTT